MKPPFSWLAYTRKSADISSLSFYLIQKLNLDSISKIHLKQCYSLFLHFCHSKPPFSGVQAINIVSYILFSLLLRHPYNARSTNQAECLLKQGGIKLTTLFLSSRSFTAELYPQPLFLQFLSELIKCFLKLKV